jgi:putative GTP pyrophosphokinase
LGFKTLAAKISKTQIDRLGDRLRKGSPSEDDLRLLDEYRRSFGEAYEGVVGIIRDQLKLQPTGRPAKSTSSLVEKLHRESIRLSQVQDIAGCRLVATDVSDQDRVVASLNAVFPGASVADRRKNPSYGYRAVHVIAQTSGKLIEIQVRTSLQHIWAEFSEALSDEFDSAIKYGGGSDSTIQLLGFLSKRIADLEELEKDITDAEAKDVDGTHQKGLQALRGRVAGMKKEIEDACNDAISFLSDKGC